MDGHPTRTQSLRGQNPAYRLTLISKSGRVFDIMIKDLARLSWFASARWSLGADDTITDDMITRSFEEWWNEEGQQMLV